MNIKEEIDFNHAKVKKLVEIVNDLVKKVSDQRLNIENLENELARDNDNYQLVYNEMKNLAAELESDVITKKIDRRLEKVMEINADLKKKLNELDKQFKKLDNSNKIEKNRMQAIERRVESLNGKANALKFKKQELLEKMRKSTINTPD